MTAGVSPASCQGPLTWLLVRGVRESAEANNVMVAIKLAIVLAVIFVGFGHVVPANHAPFIPPNSGTFGQFGWTGVFRATGVIFFAYIGFDAVSTAAEETINPQRNLPIGIIASLVICTILYIVVSGILTGVVHYDQIDIKAPIADALKRFVVRRRDTFSEMIVSGGGTKNSTLMAILANAIRPLELRLRSSDEFGLPSEAKEAAAFALLAYQTWNRQPSNVPSATGAKSALRAPIATDTLPSRSLHHIR